jgi:Ca2+-binding EF-hand superfamily protein
MKRLSVSLAVALAFVLPGLAFAQDMSADADGDGMVSMAEFEATWPDAGAEAFETADANGDGMLDADEIAAATEDGTLPAQG